MYESLYRLSRRPFAPTPDLAFYVPNASAETALDPLEQTVREEQGIGILTADVGLGKTIVCQALADRLADEHTVVFLASANYPNSRALLQAILYEIGHPYTRLDEQELRLELQTALRELREETRGLVLIIDEANFLNDALLEEVRTLTHLAVDGVPLVRVVLSAHMSFEERLIDRQMEALNQRIGCHVFLEPLSHDESVGYVAERLRLADGNLDDVLTTEALLAICQASGGVPRCLNQLCDHTLLMGYAMEEQPISVDRVHEALEDLKPLPLQWNNVSSAAIPDEHLQFCEESNEVEAEQATEEYAAESAETDAFTYDQTEDENAAVFEFGAEVTDDLPTPSAEVVEYPIPEETEESSVIEVGDVDDSDFSMSETHAVPTPEAWSAEPVAEDATTSNVIEFGASDEWGLTESLPEEVPTTAEEHVVTVPPTPVWKLNPEAMETERIRQAVGPYAWSFATEAVADRYAALDAGRSVEEPSKSLATVSVCPTITLRQEEAGWLKPTPSPNATQALPVEWIEEPTEETAHQYANPLETIDNLLPQVEAALNDGFEPQPEDDEQDASPVNAADVLRSVQEQVDSSVDLESEIGALVLETCLSTQTELYGSPRNREVDQQLAAALEETLGQKPVEAPPQIPAAGTKPKSIAEQLAEAADREPQTPEPKPTRKYGSLFTKLRRKLRS